MRTKRWRTGCGLAVVAALLSLAGCKDDPQEDAVGELFAADFAFTVDDYLRAAREGEAAVVRSFLEAGMEVGVSNHAGDLALVLAAERGHGDVVEILLGAGAKADALGPGGRTALVGAAEAGGVIGVRALLRAGADRSHRDQEGWSALKIAAFHGHGEAVGELIAGSSNRELDSALLLAAVGGDVTTLDRLLVAGADVYRRTPERETALMLAAARGHIGSIELLLQYGANRYATDGSGNTAALLAEAAGEAEVEGYLKMESEGDLAGRPVAELAGAEVERPGSVWRLQGARLEGDPDGEEPLRMARYREEQLPVELTSVESANGGAVELRMLQGAHERILVAVGDMVPKTPFMIVAVERRQASTKEGGGQPVLLDSARVRDTRNDREFVMTRDDPGLSVFSYVELRDERGRSFRGRRGDTFEVGSAGASVPFRILELRPREVLIERLDSGRVLTLAKGA